MFIFIINLITWYDSNVESWAYPGERDLNPCIMVVLGLNTYLNN